MPVDRPLVTRRAMTMLPMIAMPVITAGMRNEVLVISPAWETVQLVRAVPGNIPRIEAGTYRENRTLVSPDA